MRTTLSISIAILALSGCQSTPNNLEPRVYDANSSQAFNIANQTVLTRNDSPLRDFNSEEVSEISLKRIEWRRCFFVLWYIINFKW